MIYLFDNKSIAQSDGLHLAPGQIEKLGPVLEPASDEGAHAGDFAGSIVDLGDNTYRMYYTRMGELGPRIAVAESNDGIHWQRPVYGFNDKPGVGANEINISGLPDDVTGYCQGQVFRLAETGWRMYFWAHGRRIRCVIAESEDGIRWHISDFNHPVLCHTSEFGDWGVSQGKVVGCDDARKLAERGITACSPMNLKALRSNDATYVYADPETGGYEMYSVWLLPNPEGSDRHVDKDNAPNVLRTIHRRTSSDGLTFSDPEIVIVPDAADPLDLQFYYLSVHKQDGWRFGFLGRYPCASQTMDIELCFSTDGVSWKRPLRLPWLTRGSDDDCDSKMVIAPNRLLDAGDYWLMLYQGTNRTHDWWSSPKSEDSGRMIVCAARFLKNRFAGLSTDNNQAGRLLTKPFIPAGKVLQLDANISGKLSAELCDLFGKPLPGYDKSCFDPVSGESTGHVLSWKGHSLDEFCYDAITLRLEMQDAQIYAIHW
ncbi:MAG: hypothetical protein ABFD83_00255 [Armatimonadota bacterium]